MLRDALLAWFRSHVSLPVMHQELLRRLDHVERARVDVSLLFGKDLSVDRKPYFIRSFWEQLHIFELTAAQMAMAGTGKNEARWQYLTRANLLGAAPDAPIEVLRVDVQHGERLARERTIVVDVAYQSAVPISTEQVRVRLDYGLANGHSARAFFYPTSMAAGKDWMRCSFSPLPDHPSERPPAGPLAVFLSFCTRPDPPVDGFEQPLSNICGTLITVAP